VIAGIGINLTHPAHAVVGMWVFFGCWLVCMVMLGVITTQRKRDEQRITELEETLYQYRQEAEHFDQASREVTQLFDEGHSAIRGFLNRRVGG
jgi:hypothetical protein